MIHQKTNNSRHFDHPKLRLENKTKKNVDLSFHPSQMSKKRKQQSQEQELHVQEAKALWSRLHDEAIAKNEATWIRAIAFAGIYLGKRTKRGGGHHRLLFEWCAPAEVPIAKQVYEFLISKGVQCYLKEGTYD